MYSMLRGNLSVKALVDQVRIFSYFQQKLLVLAFKLNISNNVNCTMSLQDHKMQMYHNISRKTTFVNNLNSLNI